MVGIGRRNTLKVVRGSTPGVYLDGGELGEILLPNRHVPPGIAPGDQVEVFIYRDSEDRLVASTEIPRATVGEVATLKVVSLNPRIGAFLDWGLSKDLLLPFREQTGPALVGQEVTVRILLDKKTQRIVASMKLNKGAPADQPTAPPDYRPGQQVQCVATGKTPLGFKTLVEGQYSGLLYHDTLTTPVAIGQTLTAFVTAVRPDGKVDLSQTEPGYKRVAPLALKIIDALERNGGRLDLDDDSHPASVRQAFGVSKKAFKQALGKLYKSRRIRFTSPGIELLDNSNWSPQGAKPARTKS